MCRLVRGVYSNLHFACSFCALFILNAVLRFALCFVEFGKMFSACLLCSAVLVGRGAFWCCCCAFQHRYIIYILYIYILYIYYIYYIYIYYIYIHTCSTLYHVSLSLDIFTFSLCYSKWLII